MTIRIWLSVIVFCSGILAVKNTNGEDRPNILWLTSEDNGPELGCYGDQYADTPNIDALAAKSLRFDYCWSNAPVCAPARTTIISGMYPASLGAQHMRSLLPLPAGFRMYPQYLREAGYYCTNNSKEDYNLDKPQGVWDESGRGAKWKNRAQGQPFFAIYNFTVSHESQLRKRPHNAVHDPAAVQLPAYHPDIPEARQDWAQYYDKLTEMDQEVGQQLKELEEAGLADETIIFYYGDHGSGMPRHKRWPYNSGLHVPLIVHFPKKYQHLAPPEYQSGGKTDRLVSFVDLAPTLLSICGIAPPAAWQGHAFAGKYCTEKQPYIFGFRGRMDERIDMVRSVRNERYVYIRHFYPQRAYGQFVHYMFQTPTTRKWYELHLAGQLNPAQDLFWQTKPIEELYDLHNDPDEIHNLADDPAARQTRDQMRDVLGKWMLSIQDLGVFPEAEMHRLAGNQSPYDALRAGKMTADYQRAIAACFLATRALPDQVEPEQLQEALTDPDPVVRYWATQFVLIHGETVVASQRDQLIQLLQDESPNVRINAAEALGRFGSQADQQAAIAVLLTAADLNQTDGYSAIAAWNAIDYLEQNAAAALEQLENLPEEVKQMPPRADSYVPRLKQKTLADLKGEPLP